MVDRINDLDDGDNMGSKGIERDTSVIKTFPPGSKEGRTDNSVKEIKAAEKD